MKTGEAGRYTYGIGAYGTTRPGGRRGGTPGGVTRGGVARAGVAGSARGRTGTEAGALVTAGALLPPAERVEDPFPRVPAMITAAATTTTIPATIPTFAHVCWLCRASVVATAR